MRFLWKAILFFILTVIFTILLGGLQQVCPYIPDWVILPQLAPGMAAWLMLGLFRDQKVIFKLSRVPIQLWKYLAALGIPLLLGGGLLAVYQFFIQSFELPPLQGTAFLILVSWMLVGAFAEELGWRGYLQPLLGTRLNGLLTSLIVGVLWGSWHIGNYQYGVVYMVFFLLSTIAYSVFITWLIRDAGWNVIFPWFFHLVVNLGYYVFTPVISGTRFMILNGLVWIAAAAILLLVRWPQFSAAPEPEPVGDPDPWNEVFTQEDN